MSRRKVAKTDIAPAEKAFAREFGTVKEEKMNGKTMANCVGNVKMRQKMASNLLSAGLNGNGKAA